MIKNEYTIENNGDNHGVIIGQNNGNINISIQKVVKIPSLISTLVTKLGEICNEIDYNNNINNFQEYNPKEKIKYNCVVKYDEIIKEFSAYYLTCKKHLDIYDDSNINGKAKILKCVRLWYLQEKGKIIKEKKQTGEIDMDVVKQNSDDIIDKVKNKIWNVVIESPEFANLCREDIELGVECFTCFCFMECKILEKPI